MNEQKILSEDFEMKIVEQIINQFKPRVDDVDDAFLDRDFYQIFQNITNTTGINEWEKRGFVNNNNNRTTKQLNEVREYEMNILL